MLKKRSRFFILTLVSSMLMISACTGPGKLSYRNLADFYKPAQQLKDLSYAVYNLNDSVSHLYIRFPMSAMARVTDKDKDKERVLPAVRFRFSYQLFDGYEQGKLVDSASLTVVDSLFNNEYFEDSVTVSAVQGKNYILDLALADLNAKKNYQQFVLLPKSGRGTAADYLLTGADGRPLMRNYISRNEPVRFRLRNTDEFLIKLNRIALSDNHAALSPFAFSEPETSGKLDSLNMSIQTSRGISDVFLLKEEGVYSTAGGQDDGFRLFRFYDGFPRIGSPSVMRESLRYIASDAEYASLFNTTPRAAVDRFWMDLTGDSERALNQIRRYYSRVEQANELFTVACEGWKSDRGMIFIVFGPPFVVYRNSLVEEWTFGEPGNPLSVRFTFRLAESRNGIADYILLRSDEYRTPWHLAVSNWRR